MANFLSAPQAVKILQNSGIVAIPTETVYGLAAIATNSVAIQKIYKAKNRPADNPLICHFYSFEQIQNYVIGIHSYVPILTKYLSPGPVSYLFNLPKNSPLKAATCQLDSVICRIPNHSKALELLKQIDLPLAAPSANTSTKFSATTALMVDLDLGKRIDGIVDGGACMVGLESTILDCRQPNCINILRPGAVGKPEILNILKKHNLQLEVVEKNNAKTVTPGAKYNHYAPNTPIYSIKLEDAFDLPIGSVVMASSDVLKSFENTKTDLLQLNLGQSLAEISKNFYYKLWELDQLNANQAFLIQEDYGSSSLALALSNRLNKIVK